MDKRDEPMDDAPGALYRALPKDEPPPAIDAALLAAARRSVQQRPERRWAAPAALAAVLVLSIGVTLRVAEERPDAQMKPVAPPPAAPAAVESAVPQLPAPVAVAPPRAKLAEGMDSSSAPRPLVSEKAKPESARSARESSAASAPDRREEGAVGAPPAREGTASEPFVPSPRADSAQPRAPTAPVPASAADAPAERLVARQALRSTPQAAAESGAPSMAKSATAETAAAAAPAPGSPAAWLERIAEMRAKGRHKEADESYAEFRQRFPGYTITPEMLGKIAPPR